MTDNAETLEVLCFGASYLLESNPDFVDTPQAAGAARALCSDLLVSDSEGIAFGKITLGRVHENSILTTLDTSTLIFCVVEEEQGRFDYRLYGITQNKNLVLCLGCTRERIGGSGEDADDHYTAIEDVVVFLGAKTVRGGNPHLLVSELETISDSESDDDANDPYVSGPPEGQDLEFARGIDDDVYARMCEYALRIGLPETAMEVYFGIGSATDETSAGIDYRHPHVPLSPTAERLLAAVLDVCKPYGWRYNYNDGDDTRLSGYSKSRDILELLVTPATAIEKAQIMSELAAFLDAHLPADHPDRAAFSGSTP